MEFVEPTLEFEETVTSTTTEFVEVPEETTTEFVEVTDETTTELVEVTDETTTEFVEVTDETTAEFVETTTEFVENTTEFVETTTDFAENTTDFVEDTTEFVETTIEFIETTTEFVEEETTTEWTPPEAQAIDTLESQLDAKDLFEEEDDAQDFVDYKIAEFTDDLVKDDSEEDVNEASVAPSTEKWMATNGLERAGTELRKAHRLGPGDPRRPENEDEFSATKEETHATDLEGTHTGHGDHPRPDNEDDTEKSPVATLMRPLVLDNEGDERPFKSRVI